MSVICLNSSAYLRDGVKRLVNALPVRIVAFHTQARAHLAKSSKFASTRTLDYFRKKYPEYANNWLVSQIAVTAETVNVTARLEGFN